MIDRAKISQTLRNFCLRLQVYFLKSSSNDSFSPLELGLCADLPALLAAVPVVAVAIVIGQRCHWLLVGPRWTVSFSVRRVFLPSESKQNFNNYKSRGFARLNSLRLAELLIKVKFVANIES